MKSILALTVALAATLAAQTASAQQYKVSAYAGLSSGVERELQHAHEHAKDVFVIWKPKKEPSPFVTQTANKVFRSVDEAFGYFDQKGYFQPHSLFGS